LSDELENLKALYLAECEARQLAEEKLASLEIEPPSQNQQLQDISNFLEQAVGVQINELQAAKGAAESGQIVAESANQAKSSFLANMSHEIRTPLTAIIGFSQSIKNGMIPPDQQPEVIDIILDNGRHLLNLINGILDMSKIEANQLSVECITVDLYGLLHDIAQVCTPTAQQKGLKFIVEVADEVPSIISSDPTRLKQILLNLCNNALKFTATGQILVRVGYFGGLNMLEIDVIDSGVGIEQNKAEKLFSAFTQADESTSRQYGGTGLGLYISKQLAQFLGGDITLETQIGEGSTFGLTIECGDSEFCTASFIEYEKTVGNEDDNPDIPHLSGNVLLAEDNEVNQQLITMHINATGAKVDIACDGQRALELALCYDYDLVLMDIQMPVMDGKEALSTLNALGFSRPVVALTANVISSDVEQYTQLGFTDSLAKPINLTAFYGTLALHLPSGGGPVDATDSYQVEFHDDPLMIKLRAQFQSDITNYLQRISAAHANQDWRGLYEVVHIIKGTAGSFGFMPITDLAAIMQTALRTEKIKEALALLPELINLLSEAQND
jgi:signal transduction histidine kinase/DNA-binding NarL/FixJ family response regulator